MDKLEEMDNCKRKLSDGNDGQTDHWQATDTDINGDFEDANEASTSAIIKPKMNEKENGLNGEDNEIITVDSYTKYSEEQIRAQMVKTVMQDPMAISTFADHDFQKLIWMANRSFIVPNIGQVLEERFKMEQVKITNKLAEYPSLFDIYLFPLTINEEKFVILELAYFDKTLRFIRHLFDYFALAENTTYQHFPSENIWAKIMQLKMAKKIGGVYIWDCEFKQLRSTICRQLLTHGDNSRIDTRLALMDLKKELSEIGQIFTEDHPECNKITSNFRNHFQIEVTRLEKLMEKLKLLDIEVRKEMGSELSDNEVKIAYCQHIKPTFPRNLLKFTRMDFYTEVILEILSCLEGSRKIPKKISKSNFKSNLTDSKEKLLAMFKECQTLVDSGIKIHEQFITLSDSIRNNRKSVQYPNSKPFLDVAARATTIANAQRHLWMIIAFLKIWETSQQETPA